MRRASLFLAVALCCIQSNTWSADTYPQRAVRLIVPYPPGGAGDIVGRIRRVHAETVKILKQPDLSAQLLAQGAEPVGNSPQELSKFIAEEIRRWTAVVEQANIRIE